MDFNSVFQAISTGGAVAVLIWLTWLLINEKLIPMGRLDDQKALTKEALDGWKQANSANERLADAWEARNAAEAKLAESLRENK
jgi:hypothetical protein